MVEGGDKANERRKNGISVVLLSFNSALTIARTINSLKHLSDDIHVVDSFSADDTVAVCTALGCKVVQRPFANYADQRNWAIDNLPLAHDWQLHVDADEEFTSELVDRIGAIDLAGTTCNGFIIGRKIVFMGKVMRFGAIGRTWHYRLFRMGYGRCENRLYDQHFVSAGPCETIPAYMLDHQDASLSEWTGRHNKWSDMEMREILNGSDARSVANVGLVAANAAGTLIEKKRFWKFVYYRLPLFSRSIGYFLYSYFIRLGLLDGRRGLVFCVLQSFWFRFLVDAKIYEHRTMHRGKITDVEVGSLKMGSLAAGQPNVGGS